MIKSLFIVMDQLPYQVPKTPKQIKKVLQRLQASPNKQLGQHFLIDQAVAQASTTVVPLQGSTVVEVGPGLGVLTEQLAQAAKIVISVEKDRTFLPVLEELTQRFSNLTLHQADILNFDLASLGLNNNQFMIVANLPYNITSHFLRQILTQQPYPAAMVLLIQREVAERIVAPAGQMSLLSVSVQLFARARIVRQVAKTAFWPVPAVESSIIVIDQIHQHDALPLAEEPQLFQLIKCGFANKRKQLQSNLSNIELFSEKIRFTKSTLLEIFEHLGFLATVRAQELEALDWVALYQVLRHHHTIS